MQTTDTQTTSESGLSLAVEFEKTVQCGKGEHGVLLRTTAWGETKVLFCPCHALPKAALRLSNSDCSASIASEIAGVQRLLQSLWLNDREFEKFHRLNNFAGHSLALDLVQHVRHQKHQLAQSVLTETFPGKLKTAITRAADSSDPAVIWSVFILAAKFPDETLPLLRRAQRWPISMALAALCSHDWQENSSAIRLRARCLLEPGLLPPLKMRLLEDQGRYADAGHSSEVFAACNDKDDQVRGAAGASIHGMLKRIVIEGHDNAAKRSFTRELINHAQNLAGVQRRALVKHGAGPLLEQLLWFAKLAEPLAQEAILLLAFSDDIRVAETLCDVCLANDKKKAAAAAEALHTLRPILISQPTACIAILTRLIRESAAPLVIFALNTLGMMDSSEAKAAVLDKLRLGVDRGIQIVALETLGRLGSHDVATPLLEFYEFCGDDELMTVAGDSLTSVLERMTADPSLLPLLRRTIRCSYPEAFESTLRMLVRIASPDAVQILIEGLARCQGTDRFTSALRSLQEMGAQRVLGPALAMLERCSASVAPFAATIARNARDELFSYQKGI
jgi:hypothetical protein